MNVRILMPPRHTLQLACIALATALSGCASEPTALEQSLGESVRQARQQQAVQPSGPALQRPPAGSDGVIAVHGIERYHQSYVQPPAPVSVLNIQTGGSTPAPAMPR